MVVLRLKQRLQCSRVASTAEPVVPHPNLQDPHTSWCCSWHTPDSLRLNLWDKPWDENSILPSEFQPKPSSCWAFASFSDLFGNILAVSVQCLFKHASCHFKQVACPSGHASDRKHVCQPACKNLLIKSNQISWRLNAAHHRSPSCLAVVSACCLFQTNKNIVLSSLRDRVTAVSCLDWWVTIICLFIRYWWSFMDCSCHYPLLSHYTLCHTP